MHCCYTWMYSKWFWTSSAYQYSWISIKHWEKGIWKTSYCYIEYSPLPDELSYKTINNVKPKYFRAFKKNYTINISAGGVYFIISKKEIDAKYALISFLIKNEKIVALCEKLRTDHDEDPKHCKVAYKFNDISTYHRQMILDFVTEKSKENNPSI